jgi:hypothetical protein
MMKKALLPKWGGLAGVLAQAPALSAAFGRWPGFVLMMTALLVVLALGLLTILVTSKGATHLIGAAALSRKGGHVGAIAFRRTGDPAINGFSDANVIRKFGDVPDDLNGWCDADPSAKRRPLASVSRVSTAIPSAPNPSQLMS